MTLFLSLPPGKLLEIGEISFGDVENFWRSLSEAKANSGCPAPQ